MPIEVAAEDFTVETTPVWDASIQPGAVTHPLKQHRVLTVARRYTRSHYPRQNPLTSKYPALDTNTL